MNNVIGSTSYIINNEAHIRVYSMHPDGYLLERCWDNGKWYTGALSLKKFAITSGAAAVSWVDNNGQFHIRVYAVSTDGTLWEYYCDDSQEWKGGTMSYATTSVQSATSWIDSTGWAHIRVYTYNNNTPVEYGEDGNGWYFGTYTP